ncbi:hypothetical protein [Brevibacillus sp. MCWH]|jgi:hypothetical protein|uniref:hypothetical protein n=1 Tax=Brevibacillus sp. MCWH TaxID=2508871 RepID=UPI001491FFA0|nr:hypothetical protein [Brevibacillus sp. MCWH]NNV01675.1 hypothetical protein [Brevibacillus sp. MCWH]
MSEELKNFLHDLNRIIQDRYNDSMERVPGESSEDRAFRLGQNFAYYSDLDLIESQLKSWGYDIADLGQITPQLGNKIVR